MTGRRTTRIAALGAGTLLTLGFFSAAPAGAADGAQADVTVDADTTAVINQTLGLVNQACVNAGKVGEAATSAVGSDSGITVASNTAGTGLNLSVSLPALTDTLPSPGSLPLLGSIAGDVDAEPLTISCAASPDGTTLGLSAAGAEALVETIAPGVDVAGLIPSADVAASAGSPAGDIAASAALPAGAPAASIRATAAAPAPAPAAPRPTTSSASVRAGAAADPATAATTASISPVSSSNAPGTLARTGAGVGALGLLGAGLVGAGRLVGLGRKFLRIG